MQRERNQLELWPGAMPAGMGAEGGAAGLWRYKFAHISDVC